MTALIGLRQLDAAQHLDDEIMAQAEQEKGLLHQVGRALSGSRNRESPRATGQATATILEKSIALSQPKVSPERLRMPSRNCPRYFERVENLEKAEHFAASCGSIRRRQAGICGPCPSASKPSRRLKYARASMRTPMMPMIGHPSSSIPWSATIPASLKKRPSINASSEIYTEHFSLVAGQLPPITQSICDCGAGPRAHSGRPADVGISPVQ